MPIDFESLPLRELRKGRKLAWEPHDIDMAQDREDWLKLSADEKDFILGQVVGFLVGERAVAHDLAPLQQALRKEKGRMHEEMYLTQQMYEESVHVEFFQRWINEALPGVLGKDIPYPEGNGAVFSRTLPEAMQALTTDTSPEAQMRATVVYHQMVEAVLAELGYEIFYTCLDKEGILPGLREGLRNIQQDEARHVAFGTYFAQRLILEKPHLAEVFEKEMESIHEEAVTSSDRFMGKYGENVPFGLDLSHFKSFAETLYQRRIRTVLKGHLMNA